MLLSTLEHLVRSSSHGRHETGQNFLVHRPTIERIVALVGRTRGPILEIGAGDGALTTPLARLGRDLVAIDIDERRVRRLAPRVPGARVLVADAARHPLDRAVIVGNVPFHLTTPILRRLLASRHWRSAVLLTQWEVARKRAGIGGGTMMTAQAAPWFEFRLEGRVPARCFAPMPSVDGGILSITRRGSPLVPLAERRAYEGFVRAVFQGRGSGMRALLRGARVAHPDAVLRRAGLHPRALPRDLAPEEWAALWAASAASRPEPRRRAPR